LQRSRPASRVSSRRCFSLDELVVGLEPLLLQLLRRSRTLGPMRHNVDDCRAVMISVLERLSKNDFRGLRLFQPWADTHR
jgi:hypothetical protein